MPVVHSGYIGIGCGGMHGGDAAQRSERRSNEQSFEPNNKDNSNLVATGQSRRRVKVSCGYDKC